MEQVYPFPNRNETQLYVNCAQVEIHGPGGGTPSPLVRLEDYLSLDPGLPGEFTCTIQNDGSFVCLAVAKLC
jgi:hypothetical protein